MSFHAFLFKLFSINFFNLSPARSILFFCFNFSNASLLFFSSNLFLILFNILFNRCALIKSFINFFFAFLSWNFFILSFNLSSSLFALFFISSKQSFLILCNLFANKSFNFLAKSSKASSLFCFVLSFHFWKQSLKFFKLCIFSKLSNFSLKSSHFSINLEFS